MGKHKAVGPYLGSLSNKSDAANLTQILAPIDNTLCNRAINTPGLTIGTTSAAKVKIANETLCLVEGTLVKIAAGTEVAFTATVDDIADGYINAFLVTVDKSGTCRLEKGQPALIATGVSGVKLPSVSDKRAIIGVVTVATSGAAFVAGTTLLSAGTVTDLYYDCVGPIGIRD